MGHPGHEALMPPSVKIRTPSAGESVANISTLSGRRTRSVVLPVSGIRRETGGSKY